jgi:hypothetical protein
MVNLWFFAVQMHNLSRLTAVYSLVLAVSTWACVGLAWRQRLRRDVLSWVAINVLMLLYLLWLEIFVSRSIPTTGNIVRVITPFAITIALALSVRSIEQASRVCVIYLVVVLLGAFSMYYQVAFGAVSWFADASSRAGVTRYASLLGSLTIFGTAAPFALLCLARYVRTPLAFTGGALILLVAALLSLQKAAILGILIAFPFCVSLVSKKTLYTTLAAMLLLAFLAQFLPGDYFNYVEAGLRYFLRFDSDDVSITQSIGDRLLNVPTELISSLGWQALIAGAGLRGAGGVFGFDNLLMAHNGIIDYIAIGGIPFLAYGLWIMIRLGLFALSLPLMARARILGRADAIFFCGMAILYLANLPFSSGLQFHPNVCWVFGMLVAVQFVLRQESERRHGSAANWSSPNSPESSN